MNFVANRAKIYTRENSDVLIIPTEQKGEALMSNFVMFLKGSRFSRPGWQGMLIVICLAFIPFRSEAATDAQTFLNLANGVRQQNGIQGLCLNQQLMTAAQKYCQEMASTGNFSHYGLNGSGPQSRASAAGYNGLASETIAEGFGTLGTPQEVLNVWMGSPTHRGIILNPMFSEIGLAHCRDNYGSHLWVANYGAPSGGTHCITGGAGSTGSAGSNTGTVAQPDPGLVVYNMCKNNFGDGWHLVDPLKLLYEIWWQDNSVAPPVSRCYKYDASTDRMYVLLKNATGNWRWKFLQ